VFIAQHSVDQFLFSGEVCWVLKIGKISLIFNM